jgi:phage terminase large subunit
MSEAAKVKNIIRTSLPMPFKALGDPARYKVYYGGRGGGKSYSFAKVLMCRAREKKLLILCAREYQNSIADSVYQLLINQAYEMGFADEFNFTKSEIVHNYSGSRFIFKGLHYNIAEIKSTEGVDICWVEEAVRLSRESLDVLIPTIRKEGSELWFSFNPENTHDPIYEKFIINAPPPNSVVRKVTFRDNPYFPQVLDDERAWLLQKDPAAYRWVWEGECRELDELNVYHNFVIEGFDSPPIDIPRETVRWRFGADWGFSQDPSTLIRAFSKDGICYIDQEAYGLHVELDDIPAFWDRIPGARTHRIYADNARPETISHMKRRGYNVYPCTKYSGSIEDGIAFLQNFKKIVVHPRCKHTAEEFRLYRWKVNKTMDAITRAPEDRFNHCMDAIRYAWDEEIVHKNKGLNISGTTIGRYMGSRRRAAI